MPSLTRALRVGPQSAGADPGPACYGRGGTQPTVTDANVVLGGSGVSRTVTVTFSSLRLRIAILYADLNT